MVLFLFELLSLRDVNLGEDSIHNVRIPPSVLPSIFRYLSPIELCRTAEGLLSLDMSHIYDTLCLVCKDWKVHGRDNDANWELKVESTFGTVTWKPYLQQALNAETKWYNRFQYLWDIKRKLQNAAHQDD